MSSRCEILYESYWSYALSCRVIQVYVPMRRDGDGWRCDLLKFKENGTLKVRLDRHVTAAHMERIREIQDRML